MAVPLGEGRTRQTFLRDGGSHVRIGRQAAGTGALNRSPPPSVACAVDTIDLMVVLTEQLIEQLIEQVHSRVRVHNREQAGRQRKANWCERRMWQNRSSATAVRSTHRPDSIYIRARGQLRQISVGGRQLFRCVYVLVNGNGGELQEACCWRLPMPWQIHPAGLRSWQWPDAGDRGHDWNRTRFSVVICWAWLGGCASNKYRQNSSG